MTSMHTGQARDRVDGPKKVTGSAQYVAEFHVKDLLYGYVLCSEIAKGWIRSIDLSQAEKVEGIVSFYTHQHRPKASKNPRSYKDQDAADGAHFRPLGDEKILYSGQPIALVVAETFEAAREAARLIVIEYGKEVFEVEIEKFKDKGDKPKHNRFPLPKDRGHADKAFKKAEFKIAASYITPAQHHNPMEMHASTVVYNKDDDSIIAYDKTQGVFNSQSYICNIFGLSKKKVRVVAPFIGGAFGSGLRPQYQLFMATLAALDLKRSVRVVLSRPQMFTFGHRPKILHDMELSADSEGTLTSVKHEALSETSKFEEYSENVVAWSSEMYQCDNTALDYKLAKVDVYTPIDMRAPGATSGMFALESAIDELAVEAGVDPLEFRLLNYSERDQNKDKDYSSKELKACYKQGAERFGWSKRATAPRAIKDGNNYIGYGMATGIWEALQQPARAKARLTADGRLSVSCGTADIGTGTYTIMSQIAADALGLPLDKVDFKLGDSDLPLSTLEGGSWTAGSVGTAVHNVMQMIAEKTHQIAKDLPHSPLAKTKFEDVEFKDSTIRLKEDHTRQIPFSSLVVTQKDGYIEEDTTAMPNKIKQESYTRNTHSAVFVEVKVDDDLGMIEVSRVVIAVAAGKILNPKTARSQVLGGVVWGISQALQEHSPIDPQFGRFMNHDLALYHFPVNKDIPEIEVIFVPEEDTIVNPLGVKGLGEIGIVGTSAAVANAVYNAVGKRVRELPITLDKVMRTSEQL
jgi:xanthine dehydrogenase YagR molybdenum-binding subunit